jgi:hypothetical protein
MHLIQGEMPMLLDVTIGPGDLPNDNGELETVILFDRAPPLKMVVLTRYFLEVAMTLPWAQLTHLEAHCLYEDECINILQAAPRLVTCTVRVCFSDEDTVVRPAVPVHAHLRDVALLLDGNPIVRLWMVLDCLTLPALRTLWLSGRCIKMDSLKAFILRSQCTLEELRITDATLSESEYRQALPPFGTITLEPYIYTNH